MFAVIIPTRFDEAALREPTHRQKRRMTVEHPGEIDSFINLCGQAHDLGIVVKVLFRR